ncbi:hypothetical protein P9112_003273 [Eukaryota sp. TZLM1-RC]
MPQIWLDSEESEPTITHSATSTESTAFDEGFELGQKLVSFFKSGGTTDPLTTQELSKVRSGLIECGIPVPEHCTAEQLMDLVSSLALQQAQVAADPIDFWRCVLDRLKHYIEKEINCDSELPCRRKQINIITNIVAELSNSDNNATERITELLEELANCGELPESVLDGLIKENESC